MATAQLNPDPREDNAAPVSTASSIRTEIPMYAQDLELPPGGLYNCLSPLSDGRPQSTFEHSSQPFQVDVRDLREFHTHEDRAKAGFHLDSCAFEIFQGFGDDKTKTALEVGQYRDAQYITGEYYQDVVKLLEKRLQTKGFEIEVAILGHRVRLRATDNDKPSMSQPTKFCHIDQTATEGLMLVEEIFGSEAAEKVRSGRNGDKCMIVNVWRVLADNPANDWPLGMIDARTLDTKDLILGHLYPNGPWPPGGSFAVTDRTSSLYGVKHRETQEWWYLGQQKVEEAILMLIWDSSKPTLSCAHASFQHPLTVSDAPGRHSLEVRALVHLTSDGEEGP